MENYKEQIAKLADLIKQAHATDASGLTRIYLLEACELSKKLALDLYEDMLRVESVAKQPREVMDTEKSTKQEKDRLNAIPKGKPKSGRTWKFNKGRFSAISRPKSLQVSYEDRMKTKTDRNVTRAHEKEMWNAVNEKRDKLKQRQKENQERRLINERKGEVVQVIKNPTKLKRMKKKQLRSIQKRDLDKLKEKKST